MKCNHCGKEVKIVREFYSDIPGAVIVSRDTGVEAVWFWPADWGLKKYRGCVQFGQGCNNEPEAETTQYADTLTLDDAQGTYFDCPPEETAWLVTPCKDGYWWERIDDQIEFFK